MTLRIVLNVINTRLFVSYWPFRDFFGGKSTLYQSYISKDAELSGDHFDTTYVIDDVTIELHKLRDSSSSFLAFPPTQDQKK